jgi:hypothetical protein
LGCHDGIPPSKAHPNMLEKKVRVTIKAVYRKLLSGMTLSQRFLPPRAKNGSGTPASKARYFLI